MLQQSGFSLKVIIIMSVGFLCKRAIGNRSAFLMEVILIKQEKFKQSTLNWGW